MKTFEDLMPSEIKKVERYANKRFGQKDCMVTAWSSSGALDGSNFVPVHCEIMYNDMEEVVPERVCLLVYAPDRRRSFVLGI